MSDSVLSKVSPRYQFLQEQADDLAFGSLHLFGHDHQGVVPGQRLGPEGALDLIVIGDRDGPQTDVPGSGYHRLDVLAESFEWAVWICRSA